MDTARVDEIFKEAKRYDIDFRPKRVQSLFFGDWDSTYAGDGLEFEDIREYVPGDNPHRLHVRASAEAQRPIIVKRLEQREARITVIVDLSRSMFLREKMEIACMASSIAITSALDQRLPCGIFFAGENHVAEIFPRMGERQTNRIRKTLTQAVEGDVENIDATIRSRKGKVALRTWSRVLPKGSFIFVVSDFLGKPSRNLASALDERHYGYKVLPVVVQDELEYTFPTDFPKNGARVSMQDAEEGDVKDVWIDRKKALALASDNETRFRNLSRYLSDMRLTWTHLESSDPGTIRRKLQKLLIKAKQKR